ncbi:MAG: hypothetical protein IKU19_04230 [Clostridia bacterium]|nr:hypothetical protein [Clostridia bacterium]
MKCNVKALSAILALLGVLVIVLNYSILFNTGIVPGINEIAEGIKLGIMERQEKKNTVEGMFIDRNGEEITYAEEKGEPSILMHDEAFSHLIGFNSNKTGVSGLRAVYKDYLFKGGKDGVGAQITLTLDAELQEFCYSLLEGNEGAIIVMDSDTGEILSYASRSDKNVGYNVNAIDENYDTYKGMDGFFYNRCSMADGPAGSAFKIITATSMLENGLEDFTIEDTGVYKSDKCKVSNFNEKAYRTIGMKDGLFYSSNILFGNAAVELGHKNLRESATKYLVGTNIELDFGTLRSNFDLKAKYGYQELCDTGYGQGRTVISPMNVVMWIQAVHNNGVMLKPYMIKSITDDGMIAREEPEPQELSTVCDENAALKLQNMLNYTSGRYGFSAKQGHCIAKTGTAQVVVNGRKTTNIYMAVATELSGKKYSIVVCHRDVNYISAELNRPAMDIIDYLSKN